MIIMNQLSPLFAPRRMHSILLTKRCSFEEASHLPAPKKDSAFVWLCLGCNTVLYSVVTVR